MKKMLFVFGLLAACTPQKTEAEIAREKEIKEATERMIENQRQLDSIQKERKRYEDSMDFEIRKSLVQ